MPATASTSELVSSTTAIGEDRKPSRGHSGGLASICWRRSGEALTSVQRRSSAETAMEAWVAGLAAGSPARARRQASLLAFHCGKPPPAAAPSTRTSMESAPPATTHQDEAAQACAGRYIVTS